MRTKDGKITTKNAVLEDKRYCILVFEGMPPRVHDLVWKLRRIYVHA